MAGLGGSNLAAGSGRARARLRKAEARTTCGGGPAGYGAGVEGYRETHASVVEVADDAALIALDDGSTRHVAVPREIDIRSGQRVRVIEFDDGSPPIFDWTFGREAAVRKIYVRLLDEGVEVWRPVRALHQFDDVYVILSEPVEGEKWEFESRSSVRCQPKTFSDGSEGLVAKELV